MIRNKKIQMKKLFNSKNKKKCVLILTSLVFSLFIGVNLNRIEFTNEDTLNGKTELSDNTSIEQIDDESITDYTYYPREKESTLISGTPSEYVSSRSLTASEIYTSMVLASNLPSSIDLSSEMYFPPVKDQTTTSSCMAWANVYYAYGYMEAKDNNWNASSGNPEYLLSPFWIHNKLINGFWGGTSDYIGAAEAMLDWGIATMKTMPYSEIDIISWGEEAAWREAPYHKPYNYTIIEYEDDITISLIKNLLVSDIPVTFLMDWYQYDIGLSKATGDFILSSEEYDSPGFSHANCIVGYNDSIGEGSDMGAFRVVNSMGEQFADKGFYWLTYETFKEIGEHPDQLILFYTDQENYQPSLIATWEFSIPPSRTNNHFPSWCTTLSVGVGPYNAPLATITPISDNIGSKFLFPKFMVLDISEFQPYYDANNEVNFYLDIEDTSIDGIISSFRIERYLSGKLEEITPLSSDVPKETPGYVNTHFMELDYDLEVLTLNIPAHPLIDKTYNICVKVRNNGINSISDIDLALYLDDTVFESDYIAEILPSEIKSFNYTWMPLKTGIYNFTASITDVSGEFSIENNIYKKSILVGSNPIYIDNTDPDLNWATIKTNYKWCTGSGTKEDPYLIENLIIDGRSDSNYEHCIEIANSNNTFFTIKNCTILDAFGYGIYLQNTSEGTIIENTFSLNYAGVKLMRSVNNIILNNTFKDWYAGIWFESSDHNKIIGNLITHSWSGIHLEDTVFAHYPGRDDIQYGESDCNLIFENTLLDSFFHTIYCQGEYNNISNNIIRMNILHYQIGITIVGNYTIISDNLIEPFDETYDDDSNLYGIIKGQGHHNLISRNIISGMVIGIYLKGTDHNNISGNIINNCMYGIKLTGYFDYINNSVCLSKSDYNVISGNSIEDCLKVGLQIDVDCDENLIYNNYFNGNEKNAIDNGNINYWNNSLIGNYWHDYGGVDVNEDEIGDSPYTILGEAGSQDNLPIWNDGINIYVDDIEMRKKGGIFFKNAIYINIIVKDTTGEVVEGVTVSIALTLNCGKIKYLEGTTDQDGVVFFQHWNLLSFIKGEYICTILNLEKTGYAYHESLNKETSEEITT